MPQPNDPTPARDTKPDLRAQVDESPFRAAEFWDADSFVLEGLTHDGERVTVRRAGEARVRSRDGLRSVYYANQFAEAFPNGVLPHDEDDPDWIWDMNAWFEYEMDGQVTEDISYTLDDVLADLQTVTRFAW